MARRWNRRELLTAKGINRMPEDRVPFFVQYGAESKDVSSVLKSVAKQAMSRFIPRDAGIRLPQRPVFKVARNLKKRLVRADFAKRTIQRKGCWKCNKDNCAICPWALQSQTVQEEGSPLVYDIRQHLTCWSKHVIYVIKCLRCGVIGVGETEDPQDRLPKYVERFSLFQRQGGQNLSLLLTEAIARFPTKGCARGLLGPDPFRQALLAVPLLGLVPSCVGSLVVCSVV